MKTIERASEVETLVLSAADDANDERIARMRLAEMQRDPKSVVKGAALAKALADLER